MLADKHNKQFPWLLPQSRGFTLLEVIIATAITTILILVIYDFFQQSLKTQTFLSEQSQAIEEAQTAIELFSKELREATDADTGAYSIVEATENSIIFYSDIDADTNTERIHYFYENDLFKKGVIEPSGYPLAYSGSETETIISASVVNNESAPVFTYFNEDYPTITDPLSYPADVTSITLAKINLQINVSPEHVPDTYTLETFVQLRNLKINL